MKQIPVVAGVIVLVLCSLSGQAQQSVAANTTIAVPPLVNFGPTEERTK